ncbi:energy transducer TonB [Sphingomonas hylomeconis]|uniref:Energy transducer TonB n=1 Tax=Sphingomonas hylomeconis TaxID=1395958 RepID=A0ABV7SPH8_9SPHN|nr:energy transducer TonB [Sphingomonas hylomeconis]
MHAPRHAPDLNRWIADLGTAIARATQPDPITPGTDYRTGTALLAFTVEPDGRIADIRLVGSSGDAALDRRAIAKLRRADPLPAGPDGAPRRTQVAAVGVAERIVRSVRHPEMTARRAYA